MDLDVDALLRQLRMRETLPGLHVTLPSLRAMRSTLRPSP
jgi:hypothetical protein